MRAMDQRSALTDQRMRQLLRAGRRSAGNLSQKNAAQRAGISAVYWQKIESGAQQQVPVDTLAMMFTATGIGAERLEAEGYPDIASASEDIAGPEPLTAEEHLAATPGATAEEVSALKAVWLALRAGRTAEPFERELRRTRKNS